MLVLVIVSVTTVFGQESAGTTGSGLEKLRQETKERLKVEIQTRFASTSSNYSSGLEPAPANETAQPSPNGRQSARMESSISDTEYNALLALYNSTGGSNWIYRTGWSTAGPAKQDVKDWHGVTVDQFGRVIKLDLPNNNLTGTLPASISGLSYLKELNLDGNEISGSIPTSLGNMTGLNQLLLSNNKFTGGIPAQLGSMTSMKYLNISYNPQLGGTIPSSLGNLVQLQALLLTYSNLTGSIPSTFNKLTKLQNLYLTGNKISGAILNDINKLSSLQILQLGDNTLSGAIPANLLKLPNLRELSLYENNFSGSLPAGTPLFTYLQSFSAYASNLSGAVPDWFGDLKFLGSFNIAYNGFSGELPPGLLGDGLRGKSQFRVNNNPGLKGKLPETVSAVTGLVDISNCNFTFSDFLGVYQSFRGSTFIYAPQGLVDVQKSSSERKGFTFDFVADVDKKINVPGLYLYPQASYQWYKLVNGNEIPKGPSDSNSPFIGSNYKYTTPYLTEEEYGTYFYTISHISAPLLTLKSKNHALSVNPDSLGYVDINVYNLYCAAGFEPVPNLVEGCTPLSYEWTFGDGNSSNERTPVNVYASNGTYSVILKVKFKCGDTVLFELSKTRSVNYTATPITGGDLETVTTEVTVPTSSQVISASVQTYADNWVKNFKNAGLNTLNDFENGQSGVWNPLASYFYDGERSYSAQPNLASDGTYNLKGFSYNNLDQNMGNGWVLGDKNNSVSEEGFADESVDGLGIYSSNLYGYKGSNVIASASNARQNEILVTDFEDVSANVIGNWRISHATNGKFKYVNLTIASKFFAVVDVPLEEIADFTAIRISASPKVIESYTQVTFPTQINPVDLPTYTFTPSPPTLDLEIFCKQPYPNDPGRTILVIPVAGIPEKDRFYYDRGNFQTTLNSPKTLLFDSQFAHTGKTSMKIVNPTESITQDLLSLVPGKKYSFSSWVSDGQPVSPLISDPNQFIELIFENGAGGAISSTRFYPSTKAIAKWRKIEGDFIVPAGTKRIQTKFAKGASSALWIDDVRIMPFDAMMKSFVYDPVTLRLSAVLDEDNFGITYFYDEEGNLRLLKKETDSGIVTITEVEQFLRTN